MKHFDWNIYYKIILKQEDKTLTGFLIPNYTTYLLIIS